MMTFVILCPKTSFIRVNWRLFSTKRNVIHSPASEASVASKTASPSNPKIKIVTVSDVAKEIQFNISNKKVNSNENIKIEHKKSVVRQCVSTKFFTVKKDLGESLKSVKYDNKNQKLFINNQHVRTFYTSTQLMANINQKDKEEKIEDKNRVNELGIQMLSKKLYEQIFKQSDSPVSKVTALNEIINHLKQQGLWGKTNTIAENIELKLPEFYGKSLNEHFEKIANEQNKPYKDLLNKLIGKSLPKLPNKFMYTEGWTKYNKDGTYASVEAPDCKALVFDVEVCVTEGSIPTLATAASESNWYSWCSKQLINKEIKVYENVDSPISVMDLNDLIPFGSENSNQDDPCVIVGHNVSYDRLRMKEQYYLNESPIKFVDTMSLHIAISGYIQEQRAFAMKNSSALKKVHLPWMTVGSLNNLNAVYQHYCKGPALHKDIRATFVKGSLDDISGDFQNLMIYCATDVVATHSVLINLLPMFYERIPHPVSFSGMLQMGSGYLPVNDNWIKYVEASDKEYKSMQQLLSIKLNHQAVKAKELMMGEMYRHDPWLWNLDWEIPRKFKREKKLIPRWFDKLCKVNGGEGYPIVDNLHTGLRVVPKLLRLTWNGYPLHHEKGHGWGYLRPTYSSYERVQEELDRLAKIDHTIKIFPIKTFYETFPPMTDYEKDSPLLGDEFDQLFYGQYTVKPKASRQITSCEDSPIDIDIPGIEFIRLPHKFGPGYNVGSPLSKDFLIKIEDGTLSSSIKEVAKIVLKATKTMSYWRNARARILSQNVVWLPEETLPQTCIESEEYSCDQRVGAILPQLVVCGTVTRRAVEPTWLTASNARPDRIGSELKSIVTAPPGYHFVGADVDSQELWIAALLGDSYFAGLHGSTAMSWMTLQGNKSEGTDVHSKTALTAKITRDQAKVINYGRIYGAGLRFLQTLLMQYNSKLTFSEANNRATEIMATTKGQKGYKITEEGRKVLQDECNMDIEEKNIFTRKEVYKFIRSLSYRDPQHNFTFKSLTTGFSYWISGSESHTFNCLEDIVRRPLPVSPVLGASIPMPLQPDYVGDKHMTSRMNWVVQSSAVDYLHLMTVCMKWLAKKYDINMRYAISIHDEVRYLVSTEDRHRAALALQITNLLTRSLFAERLGMADLPLSVAFFSSVDIDKVLRKDPHDICVTPSNPDGMEVNYGIKNGDSLTIYELLNILDTLEK